MMRYKRLTVRHPNSDYISITETKQLQINEQSKKVLNRLAELEDKIENGTLIELPCKVGDTVFFAVDNGWDCVEIDEIHIFKDDIVFEWVQYDRGYELTELWDSDDFSIRDIGKTVFLTREEAEKRLKELQNG